MKVPPTSSKISSRKAEALLPAAVYDVSEFCAAHRISRSHFYALLRERLGPRVLRAGGRVLISVEAAAEWRKRCEQAV